ncbi:hypothetical protein JXL21_06750 [Candidatus Bathyarchaeota archaeon]|nr:hypothetical protein [Candidatus Bathyarchaeota archaeon]
MASFEFLAIILTGLGLTASIVYYTSVLRNANKTRESQLFMQIYSQWNSLEFQSQYGKVMNTQFETYDGFFETIKNDVEFRNAINVSGIFFEGLGVYVHRGLIDVNMVDDLMSEAIMSFWRKSKPLIYETRTRNNLPQYGEWIEYLATEVEKIFHKQHTETEITGHYYPKPS